MRSRLRTFGGSHVAAADDLEDDPDDDVQHAERRQHDAHPLAVLVLDEDARARHVETDEDRHD